MLKQQIVLRPGLSIYQDVCVSSEVLLIARLDELIERYYKIQKGPDFYCRQLGYTVRCLNGVTIFHTGKTVFRMIQERLVMEAKLLLSHSRLSVKLITYDLGFEDPAYFCRFFKKMTEMTPQQYRKNCIEAENKK